RKTHHLLIDRSGPWWYEPRPGLSSFNFQKNADAQLLFFQSSNDPDNIVCVIPLYHAYLKTVSEEGVEVRFTGFEERGNVDCWVGVGKDVYEVLRVGAEVVRGYLGFGGPSDIVDGRREEAEGEFFYDWFGWCSWNAFYQGVNQDNVLSSLKEYKDLDIPIAVVLIDDGWQNVNKGMVDFGFNSKFPSGSGIIKEIKQKFNIRQVGVWHAIIGYWDGINTTGPLSKKYKLRHFKNDNDNGAVVVDEKDVARFYEDWHNHLRKEGVDWFKVDDQVSTIIHFAELLQNLMEDMELMESVW
ncbi:hypothetical protein HK097_005784, partial [Rhizophlyctis rosea]